MDASRSPKGAATGGGVAKAEASRARGGSDSDDDQPMAPNASDAAAVRTHVGSGKWQVGIGRGLFRVFIGGVACTSAGGAEGGEDKLWKGGLARGLSECWGGRRDVRTSCGV
jgi:hypothetical protein